MPRSRLTTALEEGLTLSAEGEILVLRPPAAMEASLRRAVLRLGRPPEDAEPVQRVLEEPRRAVGGRVAPAQGHGRDRRGRGQANAATGFQALA